jgi:hypothetical protein
MSADQCAKLYRWHVIRDIIPAMRELLSTRRVFVAVLFLGILGMAARNVVDPDIWWHLKTGEWITQHHAVPRVDPFSYTRAGQPWIAHEWLSELGMYSLYRLTGASGLIVMFSVIHCAAFALLYLRCADSRFVSGAITVWGALATATLWGVRPQIISLLLASLWLLILERSERNQKLLWWTLPLLVLWVNLHAGFMLGLVFLGLFLLGELFEKTFASSSLTSNTRLRALSLTLLLDLLLVPLNPNGTRMFWYPLETLRSKAMQGSIDEWASPNFHRGDQWPFLLLLLATFAILAWSRVRVRPRDIVLLSAGAFAGLSSIRMIPFFALVAVPVISRSLKSLPRREQSSTRRRSSAFAVLNGIVLLAMAGFVSVHLAQVIRQQPEAEATHFPAGAVAYLAAHPPAGHMFNHYDWGGYLIFKLYPATRVYIDGRADLYGDRLMEQRANTYYLTDGWQQSLSEWKIRTVIVPPDAPLATGLRSAPGWVHSYQDSRSVIFSR